MKQRAAARNATYNINDLIRLTNEEFRKISVDTWKTVRRAVDAENRFFNSDVETETIEIEVLPGTSSSSDREYEEIPCVYGSDGDIE